jgi:hypothetical protein
MLLKELTVAFVPLLSELTLTFARVVSPFQPSLERDVSGWITWFKISLAPFESVLLEAGKMVRAAGADGLITKPLCCPVGQSRRVIRIGTRTANAVNPQTKYGRHHASGTFDCLGST